MKRSYVPHVDFKSWPVQQAPQCSRLTLAYIQQKKKIQFDKKALRVDFAV